jgi:cyanophycinase
VVSNLPIDENCACRLGRRLGALGLIGLSLWLGLARPARSQEVSVLGLPSRAVQGAGKLMICGGGPMPDDVFNEFVKLSRGDKARIVVIPTAHLFDSRADMEGRFATWRRLPVASLSFLDTESRDEANQDSFVEPLDAATGVWISGGSQGRLADIYAGTKVEQALLRVLERGGVIGGTSAGAAIMSHLMIRYGSPKAVVGAGFNLLARAVIDQHFLRRNRQERLLGVLAAHPEMVGLGIDEGTALVVQGDHLRVIGESQVIVCKGAEGQGTPWIETLKPGEEVDLVTASSSDAASAAPLLQHRSFGHLPAEAQTNPNDTAGQ